MSQAALISTSPYFRVSKASSNNVLAPLPSSAESQFPSFVSLVNRLEYSDKVHFRFRVSGQFVPHFTLIRGLIDFHRNAEFHLLFDRNDQSFEVKTTLDQARTLSDFLYKVEDWLVQELQFKSALKKIIRFESQYKAQQKALYRSLLGI